jgi:hypothetical protein
MLPVGASPGWDPMPRPDGIARLAIDPAAAACAVER